MNRSLSIGIAAALAGLIIGVASTAIIVRDDDDIRTAGPAQTPFVFPTPELTPVPTIAPATASPSPSPTPSPTPVASATVSTPGPTAAPTTGPTTAPTNPPSTAGRNPSNINCGSEPRFCSTADAMVVANNSRQSGPAGTTTASLPGNPTFTQTSTVAPGSGEPETMSINITIRNNTQKTFFFPEVKLVLDVKRDGALEIQIPSDLNRSFTMKPGNRIAGHFDVRLPQNPDGRTEEQAGTPGR